MNGNSSDRNLLLGIVALQMDFISRDALIEAMHGWTLDKTRSLSEILVQNGALDPADRSVLESLVERHIARHGGDPGLSLSSLDRVAPSASTLDLLDDPDIEESLAKLVSTQTRVDRETDPERTGSWKEAVEQPDGRFRIIHLHDEGGLGCVFLARDGEVNREVALKQMKEDIAADPQLRARFVFEAEITGNLEHPGIVPVYGKGEYSDGRPYYAMRFIRGDTLKVAVDRLHTDPALKSDSGARQREFQKLLRRFLVVCETMAYVHSRGIIHRDLKPRNILLGPYGETLVVDWGLAKVVGRDEVAEPSDQTLRPPSGSDVQPTTAGSRFGTPEYMSPEQARGEVDRLGPAADVYSLGATLYYMLTKQPPFTERDKLEVLHKVERGEFPPPKAVKPGVDRALEGVCLKAMALRPEDRYDSCRALADDLERWLADQPVGAYQEPVWNRTKRWVRKRKQLVSAAAVVVVLFVIGLAIHDVRLGREQERTEKAYERAADQLGMTRKALRELLNVSGMSLANLPKNEELRRDLANIVLVMLKKLQDAYPEDTNVLFETAQVNRVLAGISLATGQFTAALRQLDEAIEIFNQLLALPSPHKDARRWLAQALSERGEYYHTNGPVSKADKDFRSALESAKLIRGATDPSVYVNLRAAILINHSEVMLLLGCPQDARTDVEQAIELLEPLAESNEPSSPQSKTFYFLSIALTDRGVVAREFGDRAGARQNLEKAVRIAESISKDSVTFIDGQYQAAVARERLGRLLESDEIGHDLAYRHFDEAVKALDRLVEQFPVDPFYRKELGASLSLRGRCLLTSSREEQAGKDAERSWAILNDLHKAQPRNPECLIALGEASAVMGLIHLHSGRVGVARQRWAEADALVKQVRRDDPDRRVDHPNLTRLAEKLNMDSAARP